MCLPDRWGPDGVRLASRHAGPSAGRSGHPATDDVSPNSGLLGLPFLCRHRLCHLCRRHGVSLADGRGDGALWALHQEEGRTAGCGRGWGGGRRGPGRWQDGTCDAVQERSRQREFENDTHCVRDLRQFSCPLLDSHSASCRLPGLPVKSSDTLHSTSLLNTLE